jgi:hypothetical protein
MGNDTVHGVLKQLIAAGLVTSTSVEGCSDQEIEAIEQKLGVNLPGAYRQFLAQMGRCAGTFFQGTDFLYRELPTLRGQAEELLRGCDVGLELNRSDFVFAVHQGYTFLFFQCGRSDDPPVFLYEEAETSFRQVAESFSSWLVGCATDQIAAETELEP